VALLLAALALTGLAAGYRATLTSVTLVMDGEERVVHTHQPTVELLLADLDHALRPEDRVAPGLSSPIVEDLRVEIDHARPVVIAVDGLERVRYVLNEPPADILVREGIELAAHDNFKVLPPLATDPEETRLRLVVERAVPVVLEEGAVRTSFYTNAETVGDALMQSGITLYRADHIFPSPATPIQSGMHIRLERSTPVSVETDGYTIRTRTHRNRVGEVLADLGIALNGRDYTDPSLDAVISDGAEIKVVRVTESIVVEQSPIPFDTVWQADGEMELDTQGLLQEGEPGVLERRIRLRYEDGQVADRWVDGESVVLAPKNRIMGYGTKVVVRQLQTESGTVEYWRKFRMLATSYSASTAGVSPDNPHYGYTRTGERMRHGIIAVDPRIIPLGTNLYVPGYGKGWAGDTGGAIKGKRVDLGYDDDNLKLWYSWVEVYLLTPVPDQINYLGP
jgi:uncharacterized protein YabE (DUF348 family)